MAEKPQNQQLYEALDLVMRWMQSNMNEVAGVTGVQLIQKIASIPNLTEDDRRQLRQYFEEYFQERNNKVPTITRLIQDIGGRRRALAAVLGIKQ